MTKVMKFVVPALTLVFGIAIGMAVTARAPAEKQQVRETLYGVCVNNTVSYSPAASNADAGNACNRRSIDRTLATIYGDSYIEPIEAKPYEAELNKYKQR